MAETVKVSRFVLMQRNLARFFREIKAELKKVIWLTREQLVNNTYTVLAACFIIGLIIWVSDWILTRILNFVMAGV